jgi:hypothetical protein
MSNNNGGPAFPIKQPITCDWAGMTLRDYFAAKAMQTEFANCSTHPGDIARRSYELADAMLKARGEA